MTEDRTIVLLQAALQILTKCQNNGFYVLDVMSQTAFYDGADCDGYCLIEDIEDHLSSI